MDEQKHDLPKAITHTTFFCKEISEKLARPGYLGGKAVSGTQDYINGALEKYTVTTIYNFSIH